MLHLKEKLGSRRLWITLFVLLVDAGMIAAVIILQSFSIDGLMMPLAILNLSVPIFVLSTTLEKIAENKNIELSGGKGDIRGSISIQNKTSQGSSSV